VFENEDFPISGEVAAFVYVEIFGQMFTQESIGAPGHNLWRETGTMQLHVFVPNSSGSRDARVYAFALAQLFRETSVTGMHLGALSIGAGEPGKADGNYFPMSVTLDWERDDIIV
jgi:hypothetical protein